MEIMESSSSGEPDVKLSRTKVEDNADAKAEKSVPSTDGDAKKGMFSDENLMDETVVNDGKNDVKISYEDKIAFIDAIAENKRFTKSYSLFGGKVKFTLRSLTSDEVNAIAAWTAKIGTKDSAGLVSGRYRKYLLSAHVAMMNGVEMPPLEEPLYERLESDGKTTAQPGWIKRCDYWDGMGFGQFQAIAKCVSEFDELYSVLCSKAEDSNFWNPDTP